MTYELIIRSDDKAELIALLQGMPFNDVAAGREAGPAPTQEAQSCAKAAPVETAEPEPKQEEAKAISLEDVQRAFKEKAIQGNTKHLREILNAYGAKKVSDLKVEAYSDFLQELALVGV